MRTLPLLLAIGCATGAAAPSGDATLAPHPFTVEQIRAAMPAGTDLRMRLEEQGKPPVVLHWKVTAADAEQMTMASEILDNDDKLIADQGSKTSKWVELWHHADFPVATTRTAESRIMVPAGTFDSLDYQVRGADGLVTTYRFAKQLPGPPVLLFVEKEGLIVRTMTLLSRK